MKSLNLNKDKMLIIDNLFEKYNSFILININNISSLNMNILRKILKNTSCFILFIKKTLLVKYLIKNNVYNLNKLNMLGQTCIVFYNNDPIFLIEILNKFIIDNNSGDIVNLYFNNYLYNKNDIKLIINFPNYEFFIKRFLNLLKEVSIFRLLNILNIIKFNKKLIF